MEYHERRRHRRFPLQQSAILSYIDGEQHELAARTHNVSLSGAFLCASRAIPDHVTVQVLLMMEREGLGKISLRGAGKVVRTEIGPDRQVGLAIAFEERITEA